MEISVEKAAIEAVACPGGVYDVHGETGMTNSDVVLPADGAIRTLLDGDGRNPFAFDPGFAIILPIENVLMTLQRSLSYCV